MKQGKPIAASLQHFVSYPSAKSESYPTIVALHGRGADATDLLPLIQSLGFDDILVVAPRAPLYLNLGLARGYAWYHLGEEGIPESQTFRTSVKLLCGFLDEVAAGYPVDPQQIILLGFSQGTVMAYAAGLLNPNSIRAIAALSGYVPYRSGLPLQLRDLGRLAVFISHGAYDEIVPTQLGRESAELLKRAQATVVYREYPMGHEVREETLRDLSAWLRDILKAKRAETSSK